MMSEYDPRRQASELLRTLADFEEEMDSFNWDFANGLEAEVELRGMVAQLITTAKQIERRAETETELNPDAFEGYQASCYEIIQQIEGFRKDLIMLKERIPGFHK